ncbi:phage tail tape measure protein [Streptomyces sp. G1]|uniref:phage tail tape measure protein n=1 Tax=Streptomyces sp. G1 TaxID=361572 RepID=UPI00202E31D4|nr:phage tail tape measure protein [Streptomyces sp. G1]MCM1972334.1 phage tail tape measure protein [Streptomyces sp. G1]
MARSTAVIYSLIARDRATRTFAMVGQSATGMGRSVAGAGAAIKAGLAVGAVAAGGLGAATLRAAGDFEKSMNQVRAVSGATAKEFKGLRDQAKKLGATTKFTATQAADAQGFLAMAGFKVKDIMDAMPATLSLASAGNMDLARSADVVSNIMTGYGMKASQTGKAVDVLTKTFTSSNTNLEQLSEAFKYAGPVAYSAGISFEQTSAAIGLMGNAGIQASMAGTALRGTITRLLSPTKQIQTKLKQLGITVKDSSGKLLPLDKIIRQLEKSGATTGDMMTIFGQRAGPAMLALVKQGSGALVDLTGKLKNSGGWADRVAKIQMEGLKGQIVSLQSAWEGLLIEIGDLGVLKLATGALEGMTTAMRGLTEFVTTYGVPAIQTFRSKAADVIPVDTIKERAGQAKSFIGDLFSGLKGPKKPKPLPTPMLQAPKAPKALALPAPKPSDAQKLGKQIRDAVSGGIKGIDWGKVGSALGSGLASAVKTALKGAAKLTAAFGELLGKIDWVGLGIQLGKFAVPLITGFVVGLLNFDLGALLKGLGEHWQDVLLAVLFVAFLPAKWVAGIGKALAKIPFLGKLLSWAFGVFAKFSKGLVNGAGKLLAGFGKGFLSGLARIFPSVASGLGSFLGKAALSIVGWAGRFGEAAVKIAKGIGPGLVRGAEGLGRFTVRVIEIIVRGFAKAGSWLYRHGVSAISGLLRGVSAAAKGIGGWINRTVITPLRSRFSAAGSWLVSRGKAIVSGMKSGVIAGAKGVGGWIYRTVISPAVGRFASAGTWLVTKGRALVSGLKSGVSTAIVGIKKWLGQKVVTPVTERFAKAGEWLKGKGGALISGLKSGVIAKMKGIGKWLKSTIVDPIVSAVKKFFKIESPSKVFASIGGHLISGLVKGLAQTNGTAIAKKIFGDMPSALGAIVGKGLVSIASLPGKAMKALSGLGGKLGGLLGGLFGGGGGGKGVQKWAPLVSQVLAMLGAPASALGPVLQRMQMESGGNPAAVNLWDINAKNGTPSKGLMQVIQPTFDAYAGPFKGRGIWDPLANIYAGLNYAMHRYGGNWISVMTRPGGYAKGTRGRGRGAAPGWAWVGERGPELINLRGGEDILSHPLSMKVARQVGIKLPGYASGTVANAQAKVNQRKKELEQAQERKYGVQAAKTRLKAAQQELANAKRRTKAAVENALTAGFKKTIATGTASAIKSAIKSMITKLQNAGVSKSFIKSVLKKSEKLQSLATKKADVTAKIKKAKEFAADQSANLRDTFSVTDTSATTVGGLINEMKAKQQDAKQFASQVAYLKKQGLSADLIGQLAEAGPGSQLQTLLAGATKQQIAQLNQLSKSGITLADSYGKTVADAMFDSGKKAGEGFLTGLKEQEKQLAKQMEKLADELIKSIKKKLKIKSPSRVMADEIGRPTALGVVVGMDATLPAIARSAQRMADTAAGVGPRRIVIPQSAAGRPQTAAADPQGEALRQLAAALQTGQLGASEVHVHFNDDRLRDLIDIQVKPKIKASEDRQAFRARVGRR